MIVFYKTVIVFYQTRIASSMTIIDDL